MESPAIRNTDAEEMFGPPVASDLSGLMPTLAAIVRRIDYERRVRWVEQVKRNDVRMQAFLRKIRGH